MDPRELTFKGEESAAALACGACGTVYRLNESALAERCCRKPVCECGAECAKGYSICAGCLGERRSAQRRAAFEQAEKVAYDAYDGEYVLLEDDRYLAHDALEEAVYEMIRNGDPSLPAPLGTSHLPLFGYSVEVSGMPRIDAIDVLEGALEEYYDGAMDDVDANGLQRALDGWVAEQYLRAFFPGDKVVTLTSLLDRMVDQVEWDDLARDEPEWDDASRIDGGPRS